MVSPRVDRQSLGHVAREHRDGAERRGKSDDAARGRGGLLRPVDDPRHEDHAEHHSNQDVGEQVDIDVFDIEYVLEEDVGGAGAEGGEHRVAEHLKRDPLEEASHRKRPRLCRVLLQVWVGEHGRAVEQGGRGGVHARADA